MTQEAAFGDRLAYHARPAAAMTLFDGRYLSITSYKRDGTPVATPVWFVQEDGRLLVATDGDSYKVKRIRRNRSVRVAVCSATGRLRGPQVSADAKVLPESEVSRVERLLTQKYRIDTMIIKPVRLAQAALHLGRPRGKQVILAITPR
jgi:uncharacterized protein